MYAALMDHYGPQGWWPAQTALEVIVGAVLTQNTAWGNVEKALTRLKEAKALDARRLAKMPESELAELLKPSGTFRVKARRLKGVMVWLWEKYQGNIDQALKGDLNRVRHELLALHGVGPETADAILLYAGRRRSFVVDAYTRRIWRRHALIEGDESHEAVRAMAMNALPASTQLYQEYHALLVAVAKNHCRTRARCSECPLEHWPHDPDR